MLKGQSTLAGGGGMVIAPSVALAPGQVALTMSSSPVRVSAAACAAAARNRQSKKLVHAAGAWAAGVDNEQLPGSSQRGSLRTSTVSGGSKRRRARESNCFSSGVPQNRTEHWMRGGWRFCLLTEAW